MADLKIENLSKYYGKKLAIDDISLSVEDKEFLVLLGPSGCGKSTLLRSIAGLEDIEKGTISIGGKDVTELGPKDREISMVFQSYAVFPHLSVAKNISFGLERQKKSKAEIKERVQSAAELLHIEDLLERSPNNLSGGQRQRVAVARAIAYDAKLLLMDEPLSNLDALLRMEMRAELKRLVNDIGATVIYVTHDQTEALSMGDRVAIMGGGKIIQNDKPIEIYDNPATEFIAGFIGSPPMNLIPATVGVDGQSVQVPGGESLGLVPRGAQPGERFHLGIRAENIETRNELVPHSIEAEVFVVEPLGSHDLLTVGLAGFYFKVNVEAGSSYQPQSKIWLQPQTDKIRWMKRTS